MNRYRRLGKNVFLLGVGSGAAQVVSLVMLPIYARYLSQEEFGEVDLAMVTLSLLQPIAMLAIYEAVLRFGLARADRRREAMRIGMLVVVVGGSVLTAAILVLQWTGVVVIPKWFLALFWLQMFQVLIGQCLRALRKMTLFAIAGIVLSVGVACLNLVFLVSLRLGVSGYLLSMLLANALSIGMMVPACWRELVAPVHVSWETVRSMLRFSSPLVPNALVWWALNSASRYLLLLWGSAAAVGLYAIAGRVPSALAIVTTVFSRAWQQSSYEEYDAPDRRLYFWRVYVIFCGALFIFVSMLMVALTLFYQQLVGAEFADSWVLVPILVGAGVFQGLASFLGTVEMSAMRSRRVFWTSLGGALSTVALSVALIPDLGGIGAALSTACGFAVMWVWRSASVARGGLMKVVSWRLTAGLALVVGQLGLSLGASHHLIGLVLQVVLCCGTITLYAPLALRSR